jgi:D-tyrosyl-tRNA(Tyr) deacylase
MRALLQRVSSASVDVSGERVSAIERGLIVLIGIGRDDTVDDATYLVNKTVEMRLFPDADGRFDRSALDIGAELLVVSQFTLYADTRKGRRPSFTKSAPPEVAETRYAEVVGLFEATGLRVETGRFGGVMDVSLVNNGPVTIWLDSADRNRPRS